MANNLKKREIVVEEMDLKPFMNLMVVLIPLLLASAQFAKIATVDITLPENRGSQAATEQTERPEETLDEMMILMCLVTDTNFTVMTKDQGILTVYYKEYHDYFSSTTGTSAKNVQFNPYLMYDSDGNYIWDKNYPDSLMFSDGVQYTIHDREEIHLMAQVHDNSYNRSDEIWNGMYRYTYDYEQMAQVIEYVAKPFNPNEPFFPVQEVVVGEEYYTFTTRMSPIQRVDAIHTDTLGDGSIVTDTIHGRHRIRVTQEMIDAGEFKQDQVSAYDILKHAFLEIRANNMEAKDRDNLIIASENQVFYDKVIQVMDVAKNSGLLNISLNGLRSN